MAKMIIICGLLVSIALSVFVQPVAADGFIIPDPRPCHESGCNPPRLAEQIAVRYHHVTVTIDNQLSKTRVDQVFYNPNEFPIEGKYIFPLPSDAVVSGFTLWVEGKPVEGKILDSGQAQDTYQEIVRQMKDPALLEYIGRGAVQANIFPIPAYGERRVEIEYTQPLVIENKLVRYTYPLNTEKFSAKPLEAVTIRVEIRNDKPIQTVYSPTHQISINREDVQKLQISYEEANVKPDNDFILYYSAGELESFHLFSYLDPGDENEKDGFFLALLSPPSIEKNESVAKDILLVLDRSGSMEGEKFNQARSAATYILNHLNQNDRFYLSTFNSSYDAYSNNLSPKEESADAIRWMSKLSAAGSTNMNRALLETAKVTDQERPTYLIFLTDGLPTEGVIESQDILKNFNGIAPKILRVFPFGVGYDVDTYLLDMVSQGHQGMSTYVIPGTPLDEILSSFYTRISNPILTDVSIDFGSIETYDIYPNPLPDLFIGSQVVITGRYQKGGKSDIRINGKINGENRNIEFPEQEFAVDSRELKNNITEIPRLWATRKIGHLLSDIRLNGANKETIDQIVKLSIRYGVVTPYTSYLVTEDAPLGMANQDRISQQSYEQLQAMPAEAPSGAGAVQKSVEQGGFERADAPLAIPKNLDQQIRLVDNRTFVFRDGVWIDTTFESSSMKIREVMFLSEEYFQLAASNIFIAKAFALGEKVIVVSNGSAYSVVREGEGKEIQLIDRTPTATIAEKVSPLPPIERIQTETPLPARIIDKNRNSRQILLSAFGIIAGLIIVLIVVKFSNRKK